MSRTPRACAPSSSDSSAMRLRSRVVKWTMHSRSRSCCTPNATASAPMRTRAMALSRSLDRALDAHRARRVDLDAYHERVLRQQLREARRRRRLSDRPARALSDRRPRRATDLGCLYGGGLAGPLTRVVDVERLAHVANVLGRGAAAATDDARAGIQEARHLASEVGRLRGIDELPFDALRQTGVGQDRARQAR